MDENRITYFGETDARNKKVKFGIKAKDRTRHVYVIGKTGMGKSTMLENMAVQDIMGGEGMCFIDPHGKTADLLLEYVPKERMRDVIYIAPFDVEHPISFNVLESVDPEKRHLVVSGLMSTFKKIWEDAWSARMEYILTNTLLALLEAKDSTLLGVNRMLSDKEYRKSIVEQIKDPSVRSFWTKEFANYTERMAAEAVPAIQNKVGQFTANPLIRNMIGQPKSSFDIRRAMDERKIMIINLSKGKIGDENMKLLGGLLVTKIYLAAMSRADVPDRVMKMLPNFYLFVDEFQNFANASFADILSEARKYKLNLTIAHQYIEQMDEVVRPAVFGNVGTMITFRVGATDAEELEKEFSPTFVLEDLVNLGFTQIYLKLMIDGLSSQPFSATTLPPIAHPDTTYVNEIIAASREQFARPRGEVETEIVKFHEPTIKKTEVKPTSPASSLQGSGGAQSSIQESTPRPIGGGSSFPQPHKGDRERLPPPAGAETSLNSLPSSKGSVPATSSPLAPVTAGSTTVTKNTAQAIVTKSVTTTVKQPATSSKSAVSLAKPATPTAKPAMPSVPIAPVVKPVSLSALAPVQSSQKIDPKVPTQKNVNDLKSALAAVLKKSSTSEAPKQIHQAPLVPPSKPPRVETPKKPNIGSPTVLANSQSAMTRPTTPPEVPEDVLKNVLKVE